MFEIVLLTIFFLILTIVREIVFYKYISMFIEPATYGKKEVKPKQRFWSSSKETNEIMEDPNEISIDDPRFDLSKIEKVNIDGEERPVTIV